MSSTTVSGIFVALPLALFASLLSGGPPQMPAKQLAGLSPEERLAFVMAAIRWRNSALENCSYEATESQYQVRTSDGGHTSKERRSTFRLLRKGEAVFLGARRMNEEGGEAAHFELRWDGSQERSLTYLSYRKEPRGAINDHEIGILSNIYLNQALGIRMRSAPRTFVDWLQTSPNVSAEVDASEASQFQGGGLIVVQAVDGMFKRRFWLDPARDYMNVRYAHDDGGNWENHRVQEAQQISGLWVPKELVCRTGTTSVPGLEDEYKYVVTRFAIGTVSEKDVELPFPPGTDVVDSIRRVAYDVGANGAITYKPLYDPATGKVTVNGEPPEAAAAASTDLLPVATARPRTPTEATRQSRGPVMVAIGLATAAAGVALIFRRRARRS